MLIIFNLPCPITFLPETYSKQLVQYFKIVGKPAKQDNTVSLAAKGRREQKLPEIRLKGLRKNHFSFLNKTIIS